jgi:sec-independent protein translocase protein TatC
MDEGADRPPSGDDDPDAETDDDAEESPESGGSEVDAEGSPSEDGGSPPQDDAPDADDGDSAPPDGGAEERDPAAVADENVSDGPYTAEDAAPEGDGRSGGGDDAGDATEDSGGDADGHGGGDGPISQSNLEPAGDPDRQWGPEDDDWEDPFDDVETAVPDYDPDEATDYPANPNTPGQDPTVADDAGGGSTQQAESDGGYADPTSTTTVEEDFGDGPASDEEMPLADHIEEMVRRLGVVIVVMAVISAVVFPFAERIINFLWFSYLPGTISQCPANPDISQGGAACARIYNPLALIFARLKMATLAGVVVALPVFVYETYLFMRPGLYPKERRYYLASVPTSLILAAAGIAFAHLLVLPAIFTYFVYYSDGATVIAFGLTETFDLIVLMLGGFAIIFQIPLFVSLALMMGLVTRRWMAAKRLYFWGAFAGLAFLFSPDPTGMAPIIVAATMIVLFEGTLLLAKWTGRK